MKQIVMVLAAFLCLGCGARQCEVRRMVADECDSLLALVDEMGKDHIKEMSASELQLVEFCRLGDTND